jgi:pimeloyl-ACP methyl ester carboxylesterase
VCSADFDYNTGPTSLQPGSITFPGQVHQGFARVAASLWGSSGGIAAALKDVIDTNGKINNVYVAGHSLGAGVATLISYGTQVRGSNAG